MNLELTEHGALGGVELDAAAAAVLAASVKVIPEASGRYTLHASSKVGAVVTPRVRLVIRPKMPVRRVLYLVSRAYDLPEFGLPMALGSEPDLVDAMACLYAAALRRAIRAGLLRDYVRVEETLVAPRGRIDLVGLATRRFGVFPPVDCVHDDYTADVAPNRRLLAAARVMARVARGDVRGDLLGAASRFEGVAELPTTPGPLRSLTLDRRWKAYGAALPLADLILRSGSVEPRHGAVEAAEFVVDMNRVYEQFVVRSLAHVLARSGARWRYHPPGHTLDLGGLLRITPDAVWRDADGAVVAVVDTKYKFDKAAGTMGDIQQAVAYATVLGARDAFLVYADGKGTTTHSIRRSGLRVHVARLDPDGEPAELEERVEACARHLIGCLSEPPRAVGSP